MIDHLRRLRSAFDWAVPPHPDQELSHNLGWTMVHARLSAGRTRSRLVSPTAEVVCEMLVCEGGISRSLAPRG